jgi:hypothetical protein
MSPAVEIAGWVGAGLLILAYALASWERIAPRSLAYQLLNLAGSVLVLLNSACNHAIPSVAVNLFWMLVGLGAVIRQPIKASSPGLDRRGASRPATPTRTSAGSTRSATASSRVAP